MTPASRRLADSPDALLVGHRLRHRRGPAASRSGLWQVPEVEPGYGWIILAPQAHADVDFVGPAVREVEVIAVADIAAELHRLEARAPGGVLPCSSMTVADADSISLRSCPVARSNTPIWA